MTVGDVLTLTADDHQEFAAPTGGGLPTGWTQDEGSPASLDSNGGGLDLGNAELIAGGATLGEVSGTPGILALLSGAGGDVAVIPLTVDPTDGAGVARSTGSLGLRLSPAQLWQKTGAGNTAWTQVAGLPSGLFVQSSDPGAAGAGSVWIDTGGDAPILKIRDAADTSWAGGITVDGIQFPGEDGVIANAAQYHFPPYGGGFTIEPDGSKINVDTPLDMGGTGILASGNIDMDGDDLQNVGVFSMSSPPEIPATPSTQDVVDALVTLGLVTQAAP